MRKQPAFGIVAAFTLVLLGGLGSESAQAGFITYEVTVNTAAISGQSGNLDFQFNPGDITVLAATATISNFQKVGGNLALSNILTGDASGVLPGTLTLDNGTVYNDIFQGFTYGGSFSFDLTLSGSAVGTTSAAGSSFALSLYDSTGTTPLLTTDPNGSVLTSSLNGTATVETFAQSPTNDTPAAEANPVSAVPAPPSLILLISALPAGLLLASLSACKPSCIIPTF